MSLSSRDVACDGLDSQKSNRTCPRLDSCIPTADRGADGLGLPFGKGQFTSQTLEGKEGEEEK
jgi:hypothetical protein